MNKLRFAIVGCGWAFDLHAPSFRLLKDAELSAVVDPDKRKRTAASEKYSIPHQYSDFDQAIKENKFDAVIIASPSFLHREHVINAARAGKNIFCEKPMAISVPECKEMIKEVKKARVKFMMAQMKRYNPANIVVKELISSGELGEIFHISVKWNYCVPHHNNWRYDLKSGGGLFQDHGSHTIDLVNWWINSTVEKVSGKVQIINPNRNIEDMATCVAYHKNGILSVHQMMSLSHWDHDETYDLFGTKGTLSISWPYFSSLTLNFPQIKLYRSPSKILDLTNNSFSGFNLDENIQSRWQYLREIEAFCDFVKGKSYFDDSIYEGKHSVEVINALYLATVQEKIINLPLKEKIDLVSIFKQIKKKSKHWENPDYDEGEVLEIKRKLFKKDKNLFYLNQNYKGQSSYDIHDIET